MEDLEGSKRERIVEVIASAFNEDDFTRLLQFKLNLELDHIVASGAWKHRVFEVVEYAVQHGIIRDLISAVARERPKRKDVQELYRNYVGAAPQDLKSSVQVKSVTSKLSDAAKYIPALYVERALEADIHNFLNEPVTGKPPHCFLLIAPAGCGKTSLLCHIAEQSSQCRPTFLLLGAQLRIEDRDSFLFGLRDHFERAGIPLDANRSVVSSLADVCRQTESTAVVIVDGINEYHDPTQLRREIGRVLEDTSHTGVRFVFSCRDFYWGLFEAPYWRGFTTVANSAAEDRRAEQAASTTRRLANFSHTEDSLAFEKYFAHYQISVHPEGNAREQFRHPLLLRFFCETYRGENVGTIRDVRLKNLFDRYWQQKLQSMAERMRDQGELALLPEIVDRVAYCIIGIAREMLHRCSRSLPASVAREQDTSRQQTSVVYLPYGRIIDEYIILEEVSEEATGETQVAFVFEEFMEYAMARALFREWLKQPLDVIVQQVADLTEKYAAFSQVFGVILYLALMLKEERGLALWPALIGLGDRWQKVVVEAFRKLPADQVDDGVFAALVDLLQVPAVEIRINALELLKHGRLKRVPPPELVEAVGRLASDSELRVRRRAIHALGECPPEFAVPLIERALTSPVGKASQRAPVIEYAIKALAKLGTAEVFAPIARAIASYWHADLVCHEALTQLQGREAELIPLLHHPECLVRWGAMRLLGCSDCTEALGPLEQILAEYSGQAGDVSEDTLPPYFSNKRQLRIDRSAAKRENMSVTQLWARKAIESIRANVQYT